MSKKVRYEAIDVARGFAILLVVWGHYYYPEMPAALRYIHEIIYMFHMPLFLFVSGFLAVATRKHQEGIGTFLTKKFRRLIIPYLSVSLLILAIKLVTENQMQVDNAVAPVDLLRVFYSPVAGYFLWFSWALWWMMCIISVMHSPKSRMLLLITSFIVFPLFENATQVFCIRQTIFFMPYFASGAVCFDIIKKIGFTDVSTILKVASILLFGCVVCLHFYLPDSLPLYFRYIEKFVLAFAGIAASISIGSLFTKYVKGFVMKCILSVSAASYTIYLFHTTFEGFAKGVLAKVHFMEGGYPDVRWAIAVILVVGCGTLVPYLLDKFILKRYKITRFLFGV